HGGGVVAQLLLGLLEADEERALVLGGGRQEVQPQGGLALAGPAPDEVGVARQVAAGQDFVQLADAGRDSVGLAVLEHLSTPNARSGRRPVHGTLRSVSGSLPEESDGIVTRRSRWCSVCAFVLGVWWRRGHRARTAGSVRPQ